MTKLLIHGDMLAAAEALARAEEKFGIFKAEGTERLRMEDIQQMREVMRQIERSRRMLVATLGAFETIAEKVAAVTTKA